MVWTGERKRRPNPASHRATIILRPGSSLDRSFLVPGDAAEAAPITAGPQPITIRNQGAGTTESPAPPEAYEGTRTGYLNWSL